jgi:hypothetical protein
MGKPGSADVPFFDRCSAVVRGPLEPGVVQQHRDRQPTPRLADPARNMNPLPASYEVRN